MKAVSGRDCNIIRALTQNTVYGLRMNNARAAVLRGLLLTIILIYPAGNSYAGANPPKNPNSAKACALCHYRWIDTFFIEGRGSELVDYTSEKVVATPEMCFSCHDGSVADSRAKAFNNAQHKINVAPPADMHIPQQFPLDDRGRMQCATCHSAHGVPSGPNSGETIFMRTSNRDSAMCRMCHRDKTGGAAAGNHPLVASAQEIPREILAGYGKFGDKNNQVICETCHTAHGSSGQRLLVADSRESSLCLICHPDKNAFTTQGRKKPFHIINAIPAKAKIPATVMKRGARTGDRGAIICQTCHRVHNNQIETQLLVIAKDRQSGFCLTCHQTKQDIIDTKHNLGHTAPGEKNLLGETVAEAGVCSACHLPHKAARRLEGSAQTAMGLCLSCHGKGRVAANAILTGRQHPVNLNIAAGNVRTASSLPLFNDAGLRDENGKIMCATCHDPHRWKPRPTVVRESSKMQADSRNSFLRMEYSPAPRLCANCHVSQAYVAGTDHDMIATAPASKNISGRTPLESGTCGTCHLVHNSRGDLYFWSRGFGEGNNIMEMMCNSCHSPGGPAGEKVPPVYLHPREKPISNKGRGAKGSADYLPVYHGATGEQVDTGNISCPSCHNVHQWSSTLPAAGSGVNVEGNLADSFLRSKASFSLCNDCHESDAHLRIKNYHDADKRKFKGIDELFVY